MNCSRKEIQNIIRKMLEMLTREELVSLLKMITAMIGRCRPGSKRPEIDDI